MKIFLTFTVVLSSTFLSALAVQTTIKVTSTTSNDVYLHTVSYDPDNVITHVGGPDTSQPLSSDPSIFVIEDGWQGSMFVSADFLNDDTDKTMYVMASQPEFIASAAYFGGDGVKYGIKVTPRRSDGTIDPPPSKDIVPADVECKRIRLNGKGTETTTPVIYCARNDDVTYHINYFDL